DDGIATGDTGVIWSLGGIMLAVAFAQLGAAIGSVWFAARSSMSIGYDLRAAIFRRVSGFSSYQMSQFGPATLITRATNDVQQLQMVTLMSLSMLVMAPIMAAGGVVMALREDRSEEHTSELQSRFDLVCRLLHEKKESTVA